MHLLAVDLSIAFLLAAEEADESKQGNLSFSHVELVQGCFVFGNDAQRKQGHRASRRTPPHFARHEECADKIADFANCLALLDTGHIVRQPNADFLAKPESASIQCFLLYYCPMG